MATELRHGRLEGHAGTRGGLLEDHRQGAVGERRIDRTFLLQPILDGDGALDEVVEFFRRKVKQGQKVPGGHRAGSCQGLGQHHRKGRHASEGRKSPTITAPGWRCLSKEPS